VPDLSLQVTGASVVPFAATPTLAFAVRLSNQPPDERIHSIALRCQIRIEAARRTYDRANATPLLDLFGEPDRWSQTVRDLFWTHAVAHVPPFVGATAVDLAVPCTFDFNVAATKYFFGLPDGDVPLLFLFSGSVFYEGATGVLQVYPISWEKESRFRLPVATWRELMETYYPNTNWLTLRRDLFERLYRYKQQQGIPSWDAALERILALVEEQVPQ
jgi:hypothetical protein